MALEISIVCRALVNVGAVGAGAPTDFQENWFYYIHRFLATLNLSLDFLFKVKLSLIF